IRHLVRAENEGAGRSDDRLAGDPDRELAVEDVEPLVLVVVDVQRRAGAARRGLLGQHHPAAGRRAIGLDRRQATEEPEVLSLTGTESDGCESAVRRGGGGGGVCCADGGHACSLISATGANHPPRPGIFLARGARLTRMGWTIERL